MLFNEIEEPLLDAIKELAKYKELQTKDDLGSIGICSVKLVEALYKYHNLFKEKKHLLEHIQTFVDRELYPSSDNPMVDSVVYVTLASIRDHMKHDIFVAIGQHSELQIVGSGVFLNQMYGVSKERKSELAEDLRKKLHNEIYDTHWDVIRPIFYEALQKLSKHFA